MAHITGDSLPENLLEPCKNTQSVFSKINWSLRYSNIFKKRRRKMFGISNRVDQKEGVQKNQQNMGGWKLETGYVQKERKVSMF